LAPERATLPIVTAVLPLLVTVRLIALLLPVLTVPKATGLGLNVRLVTGVLPVPDSPMDCGLPLALSVTAMDADRALAAEGENVTAREQAAPTFKVVGEFGQLLLTIEKSPGLVPPSTKLVKVIGLLPVFETVTLCELLVVPVFWAAKVRLPGLKVSVKVANWPVPVKPTDCGLPVALSVTEMEALRVPAAVGEKATPTEQLPPAARVVGAFGQLLLENEKSPALAPASAKLLKATGLLPVLLTVTT
jgi:hypothetical protein